MDKSPSPSRCDEVTEGYYFEFNRGYWVKKGPGPTQRFPGSGLAYAGSLTKEQADELERIIRDFIDGKVTVASETQPSLKDAARRAWPELTESIPSSARPTEAVRAAMMRLHEGIMEIPSKANDFRLLHLYDDLLKAITAPSATREHVGFKEWLGDQPWHAPEHGGYKLYDADTVLAARTVAIEECAKVCDDYQREGEPGHKAYEHETAAELAARIRARPDRGSV